MCGLCSRPHSLVSPVLYVSATPRYPTSEWGSFCSSSPGARRTPAWHSLENVLRGGTRAAGTLNGLIVILFGQPRFSTWRRARARAALRPAPPGSRRPTWGTCVRSPQRRHKMPAKQTGNGDGRTRRAAGDFYDSYLRSSSKEQDRSSRRHTATSVLSTNK